MQAIQKYVYDHPWRKREREDLRAFLVTKGLLSFHVSVGDLGLHDHHGLFSLRPRNRHRVARVLSFTHHGVRLAPPATRSSSSSEVWTPTKGDVAIGEEVGRRDRRACSEEMGSMHAPSKEETKWRTNANTMRHLN